MLVNCIAFYKRPLRQLAPAQVVSGNAFGSDRVASLTYLDQTQVTNANSFGSPRAINGYQLAPSILNNSNAFGADKFVKSYAQTQVVNDNVFGDNIIGSGVSAQIVDNVNTFGSDKFVKIYYQTGLWNTQSFGSQRLTKLLESAAYVQTNTFGANSFTKKYAQTQVTETNVFGSDTVSNVSNNPPVIHDTNSVNMGSGDGTSKTITLSNVATDDIIVLVYSGEKNDSTYHTVTSVSDNSGGGGYTWTKRSQCQMTYSSTLAEDLEVWWAHATSSPGTLTITVNISSALDDGTIGVFRVTGCNTSSPWDSNGSLPATQTNATSSGSNPSLSVSTDHANALICGFFGTPWGNQATNGSGYTQLIAQQNNGGAFWNYQYSEYKSVTATQSGLTVNMGNSPTRWAYIVDALRS